MDYIRKVGIQDSSRIKSQKNLSTMQYGNFFNDYIPSSATILWDVPIPRQQICRQRFSAMLIRHRKATYRELAEDCI